MAMPRPVADKPRMAISPLTQGRIKRLNAEPAMETSANTRKRYKYVTFALLPKIEAKVSKRSGLSNAVTNH